MKILYLLRHAKSVSKDIDVSDFERPLTVDGLETALKVGQYMKDKNYIPQIILSSPSVRTKQTLAAILEKIDYDCEIEYLDSLYSSDWEILEKECESRKEDSLLLVGHNPEIEEYLSQIIGQEKFMKTSDLAVIDMEEKNLLDFVTAKEL